MGAHEVVLHLGVGVHQASSTEAAAYLFGRLGHPLRLELEEASALISFDAVAAELLIKGQASRLFPVI